MRRCILHAWIPICSGSDSRAGSSVRRPLARFDSAAIIIIGWPSFNLSLPPRPALDLEDSLAGFYVYGRKLALIEKLGHHSHFYCCLPVKLEQTDAAHLCLCAAPERERELLLRHGDGTVRRRAPGLTFELDIKSKSRLEAHTKRDLALLLRRLNKQTTCQPLKCPLIGHFWPSNSSSARFGSIKICAGRLSQYQRPIVIISHHPAARDGSPMGRRGQLRCASSAHLLLQAGEQHRTSLTCDCLFSGKSSLLVSG